MKKIVYGKNSLGSYCTLYAKFLWWYMPDTFWGSSKSNVSSAEAQAMEWKEQYNVTDDLVIRKDI